ncbi:beta-lactamase family protein [Halorhodospira halochloris]|uniref:serine hydrolase domain-containing protein n=1 Tax=Halorhodospira halochloris TaxID=1052 RepID=UPI001EE87AD4|nr:serine hydrolase [Halorhodospira halochloris]MCG5529668.1 beta-lactamase family protein [Halorhodospira halochloris]
MRRLLSILLKGLAAFLLLLVCVSTFLYLSDPIFYKRLATAMQGMDVSAVEWRQPNERVPGGDAELEVADEHELDAAAVSEAIAYAEHTDSMALLVYHRGALVVERYWEDHASDSRFDSGSMHKSVLGLLIGAAIDDGYIESLNDPVGKYIEEWSEDERGDIALRELLTMSSGLKVEAMRPTPFNKGMRLMLGADINELALSLPREQEPGQAFEYMNFNSQILGIALARAVERPYAEYLAERIWQPLGAPDAAVWLDREGGDPRTFCCLLTSARAWVKVGKLFLNEGRVAGEQVLPAEWIRQMASPSEVNPNYGLHVWLGAPEDGQREYNSASDFAVRHSAPYKADDVLFFDGAGGQRLYVIPSAEMAIVRIGHPETDWDDAILPNTLLRGL